MMTVEPRAMTVSDAPEGLIDLPAGDETLAASRDGLGAAPATGTDVDDLLLHRDVKGRMFGKTATVMVGGYIVMHRLGAGGMGVVYAARDPELQRDVALKLVLPGHRLGQERIQREARALAKVSHPNVVTVHEVGTHGDQVFVAMELVVGTNLRQWLASTRGLAEIANVFQQAADGLSAAHRKGLVHRDFKPENVLIGDDGRVRVVDFGLARTAGFEQPSSPPPTPPDPSITRSGELLGTPSYMAYEQLGGGELDARTDVFAFCVTLYEALHRRRPYEARSSEELLTSLQRGPSGLQFRRDLPRTLVALMRRGLSSGRDVRPASLEPFSDALRRLQSPPRRRALAVATGAVLLVGGGSFAAEQLFSRSEAVEAPTEDPASVEEYVCPEPDDSESRSCEQLAEHLLTAPLGHEDWGARCAYRRACSTPDPVCPERTRWDGSLGCALAVCDAESDEQAIRRCDDGDATCCERAALLHGDAQRNPDELARRARLVEALAKACAANHASACADLATTRRRYDDDEASALKALVTACELGDLHACRRVAILPEDREGLRPECTLYIAEDCREAESSPVQLAHFAMCSTAQWETPAFVTDDEHRLSHAFEQVGVSLEPGEHEAIDRAVADLREELTVTYGSLWRELVDADEPNGLEELASRVGAEMTARHDAVAHRRAQRRLVDSLAGITPTHPATQATVLDRWYASQVSLASRLEEAIAAELGAHRASALRRARNTWPASDIYRIQGRCPD